MLRNLLFAIPALTIFFVLSSCDNLFRNRKQADVSTAMESCRDCHEHFYSIWDNSPHSGSLRPLTPSYTEDLYFDHKTIIVDGKAYVPERRDEILVLKEQDSDHSVTNIRPVALMGNRDNQYFLSRTEQGSYKLLPVAYNQTSGIWFIMRDSVPGHCRMNKELYTSWIAGDGVFTTSCFSCHVNPASTHFDPATNSYLADRLVEGINCESCHGEAQTHDRAMRMLKKDEEIEELYIKKVRNFSHEALEALCLSCHSDSRPLTAFFPPGEKYLDHYKPSLTVVRVDAAADTSRRHGYLYSGWQSGPAMHRAQMDCMNCHNPAGEYRFAGSTDNSCITCHSEIAEDPVQHTHHPADSPGSRCINCHMPATVINGHRFTDHSMQAPSPLLSIRAGFENACNNCHQEKSVWWAESTVKRWYPKEYEDSLLLREIPLRNLMRGKENKKELSLLFDPEYNPVYTALALEAIAERQDTGLLDYADNALTHSSPLVRSAAIDILSHHPDPWRIEQFSNALIDEYRIVRISAMSALLLVPDSLLSNDQLEKRETYINQYATYLLARPDDWQSYKRLGDLFLRTGKYKLALNAYESAISIDPMDIEAMISAGITYARSGNLQMAIMMLRRAIDRDPENETAHWNLALVYLENQQSAFAENEFRKVLEINESSSPAAYNLAVIISDRSLREAVSWIRKAVFYAPDDPKYIYTLSFYLNSMGKTTEASGSLRDLIVRVPTYGPAYLLLGSIYEQEGMIKEARQLYLKGLTAPLSASEKEALATKLQQVGS